MFFASTSAYFDWGNSRIQWNSSGQRNTLYEYEYGNYYIKNMVTSLSKTGSTISTSRTNSLTLGYGGTDRFRTYYLKFYDGDTLVKDFIPWTDMNGNYGLFDKVSLSVYNVASGTLTGSSNVTDVEVGSGYTYPLEYVVREDPPNNLSFSSMTEAEEYECPWVGMHATIDGDKYVFSGDSQSGYEWVYQTTNYTEVEYIECRNGGVQLLNNVTTDYYFEVESQFISGSGSPNLIGEKSDTEVVSYQMGLCYYSSNMFFDYGGGRFSTNINSTTQAQKHKYGAGYISGSSYPTLVGVTIDGVTIGNTNQTVRVEGLPYLVGSLKYTGHTASDVVVNNDDMIIYSVKIYRNYGDTLVGDYIPVKDSNNVVTMYDKVSGNFATPYGTLIAGPAV